MRRRRGVLTVWLLLLLLTGPVPFARAQKPSQLGGALPDSESGLHVFPTMFDSAGKKIAQGEFIQSVEGERLHAKVTYDFGEGHRIEEQATFRTRPVLVQEQWSWKEVRRDKLLREFQVDFGAGKAHARKLEGNSMKDWTENVKIQPGHTFAGFGFTLAIRAARARLIGGEKVQLDAVGFTPKPRVVGVEVTYGGVDELKMGQQTVTGERFIIHPKIPVIARAFIEVHDTGIWLTSQTHDFLRWEGPLLEPSDPIVRVDLLPRQQGIPGPPLK